MTAKKHLLVAAGALFLCSVAEAQQMTAEIPFQFQVGAKSFPAGRYQLTEPVVSQPALMMLHGPSSSASMIILATVSDTAMPGSSKLVFHRYGDSYFLAGIAKDSVEYKVKQSRAEQWIANHTNSADVSTVATMQ